VGIGTSSFTGANTFMDDLVVYNATAGTGAGLSIIGNATNGYSSIAFGDTADWDTGRLQYSHTDNSMAFHTNSAERMQISSAGNVTVKTGNLVIGTSGKGIDFSASTDGTGTVTSEVLDDYEEGTWSPVWTPDSGTIVTNTTYTGGVYTKVGNLVTVHCRLYTSSVSSPTGKITISGLPYAIKNSPYTTPYVLWPLLGLNGSLAGMPIANTLPNTTTLQLSDWSWGTTESGSNIADKFDADVWCHAGLTYMTN
jgi:hypothetical protein